MEKPNDGKCHGLDGTKIEHEKAVYKSDSKFTIATQNDLKIPHR